MSVLHTPGPWTRHDYRIFREDPPTQRNFRQIATCASNAAGRTAEAEANARLIAAAPDLLAAARAVAETCPCDPDINPQWEAAWDALATAIVKAEGR